MPKMLTYEDRGTFIHSLCGATKLLFFIAWSVTGMVTYDTRILGMMFVISLILLKLSRVAYRDFSFVFKLVLLFLMINLVAIFLFSPEEGVKIYASRTVLLNLGGRYTVTAQQLFYEFNVALKYFTIMPIALLFILTTNPSEFASSLNRLGISYKISYSVAITLRYIPDMQRDYATVSQAQQARGLDTSRRVSLLTRIKNAGGILIPLFLSSMAKIETISNALELRGFGKKKHRTWYAEKPFEKKDSITLALLALVTAAAFFITFSNGSRFFNPFL